MSDSYSPSEYELKRLERIRKNEAYLELLGLQNHKAKLQQATTKKTKHNAARSYRVKPGEERRSNRIKNSPDNDKLMMLSYDDDGDIAIEQVQDDDSNSKEEDATPQRKTTLPTASFRKARRRIALDRQDFALTKEEKETLTKNTMDSSYLVKFQEFLVYHNKIGKENLRKVMCQVTKLATGQGVRYESLQYGWHEPHQIFKKGVKISPLADFVALMEQAQTAEDEWGRDHGNGWLLRHPLKKMLLFQQFCLQNPDFLGSQYCLKEYYAMGDIEDGDDNEDDVDEELETKAVSETRPEDSIPTEDITAVGEDMDKETATASTSPKQKSKRGRPKKSVVVESPNKKKKQKTGKSKNMNKEHIGSRLADSFEEDDDKVDFGTPSTEQRQVEPAIVNDMSTKRQDPIVRGHLRRRLFRKAKSALGR